ncbi:stage V sporulation protein AE [Bacillus mesophilus]|uniref:Stage V sporulation protein AE n=1 Tax=Bacillus mesophilus TaxID=1808955 RepID=A0A6M0Q4Z0_9BACI|nr:stage V sporulation protein AE [Bacillus mesophilus]MBM7661150.1 stage V sporulation protein AE [Bacillus mesophilus]NEY71322.1 stage V sporulation protein AE [Bacillus mesophilus]
MEQKRKVILVTDGDEYAHKAVQHAAKHIGGRCISQSQGNPSLLTGQKLVQLILQTPYDPVFVLFDDCGYIGEGAGERALLYVANHTQVDVLGVIAVASKSHQSEWTKVDVCIDRFGELTEFGIDKYGLQELEIGRINGDTVYCLDQLDVPIVVGVGDIGKMAGRDDIKKGCPITLKAVEIILERSGYYDRANTD